MSHTVRQSRLKLAIVASASMLAFSAHAQTTNADAYLFATFNDDICISKNYLFAIRFCHIFYNNWILPRANCWWKFKFQCRIINFVNLNNYQLFEHFYPRLYCISF